MPAIHEITICQRQVKQNSLTIVIEYTYLVLA